jgi:DNA repair protein RadC
MIEKGIENLSEEELVMCILGSGGVSQDVRSLAKEVIRADLMRMTLAALLDIGGMGVSKASRLLAARELGRRLFTAPVAGGRIQSTDDVLRQCTDIVRQKQEHVIGLFVNGRDELIQKQTLAIGTLNASHITPREVLYQALLLPAAGFFIVHNHPSGDPTPSDADIEWTKRLVSAGELMGIALHDHIIVAHEKYYSFLEGEK